MFGKDRVLSLAILIFATGFLFRSFPEAIALQTSAISLGSNPIVSWSGRVSSDGWITLGLLSQDFVITDFQISNNNGTCQMLISTSTDASNIVVGGAMKDGTGSYQGKFATGIFVSAGETLYLYHDHYNDYCYYNISGYYTH